MSISPPVDVSSVGKKLHSQVIEFVELEEGECKFNLAFITKGFCCNNFKASVAVVLPGIIPSKQGARQGIPFNQRFCQPSGPTGFEVPGVIAGESERAGVIADGLELKIGDFEIFPIVAV